MKIRLAVVALALATAVAFVPSAAADETTYCNNYITSLPYTINVQGHYCLNKNLSTAITSGAAITINADFVWLDLNNFKVGGGSAGLGTNAYGVYSRNHRQITVRNGNIRGFKVGVYLTGTNSGELLVENNVIDGNTWRGVWIDDTLSAVIRNNFVSNTGGSTSTDGSPESYGIYADYYWTGGTPVTSQGATVAQDNTVVGTNDNGDLDGAGGIGATIADHNHVVNGNVAGSWDVGVWAWICRDNNTLYANDGNSCSISVDDVYDY